MILGTNFSFVIVMGAVLGAIGAYIMVSENGIAGPVKNVRNRGALMAVLVALIFSFWAIASRFGATNMNPLLFAYLTYITGLIGFGVWQYRSPSSIELEDFFRKDVFGLGTVTAASAVIGIYAYSLISDSGVTIIKQTSGIFGVLIGGRFFKEKDIFRKLIGAGMIISAVVLIML